MLIITWLESSSNKIHNQQNQSFRVKRNFPKILRNRKHRIACRLNPNRAWSDQPEPMFDAGNIHYQMSDKTRAINCGGVGAIALMVEKLGLCHEIDSRLHLLKKHLPYHESDHVLNLAYNALLNGSRLQDIELRRNDEVFLDAMGAQRIPDPTTSGDFCRRFAEDDLRHLMDAINVTRTRVWEQQSEDFLEEAFIDVDGTITETLGECKGGMSLSYKGILCYAPLVVSLANTREVLYLVNRPGNEPSHSGCIPWIDSAIELVSPHAGAITLRGDTDFTSTGELDRWNDKGVGFVFGMDAHPKVVKLADALNEEAWTPLERLPRYEIATKPRSKAPRIKEGIVRSKGYTNKVLGAESITEMEYRPLKCGRSYRLIILRKNISVLKGEEHLIDEVKYFFYLTNRWEDSKERVVGLANGRCDQENVISQLKNGVNAMRMPVDDLMSNWAYMVMTALAWNMKAWFALLMPQEDKAMKYLKMEYRTFLNAIILIPAQIIRSGRRIVYRILAYNDWLEDLFAIWERLRMAKAP